MSHARDTRFKKGQSGNPGGRPKKRRPNVSAFDIVFDKTLTVAQHGVERELTVDEALQMQTYQAALKGSRMAVRSVLKMIAKREAALATLSPPRRDPVRIDCEYDSDNANAAMLILGVVQTDPAAEHGAPHHRPLRIATWAAKAALSRPGRRTYEENDVRDIKFFTQDSDTLVWPRGSRT